jgi:23S rRNA G2069 N7-methylase RlmK/C1962 C5-methylase RlmI
LNGHARPGDTVDVVAANGRPLARAAWSPESKISARVWTFDPDEIVDDAFFSAAFRRPSSVVRTAAGVAYSGRLAADSWRVRRSAWLIADRYGDTVVVQLTATGPEKWRRAIIWRAASGERLCAHLRAIRFRRAPTGRARPGHGLGAWRSFFRAADDRRARRTHARQHRLPVTKPASILINVTTAC